MPNQLVLIVSACVLIFVCLIIFLIRQMKKATDIGGKLVHVLFFIFILLVIILPFAGVFKQKPVPIIIYSAMALSTFIYFVKMDKFRDNSDLIRPNNYRNFVLQNFILVLFNSPYSSVLPDNFYSPDFNPKYEMEKGPAIYVDESHHNYHTVSGLYKTFANILRKDGYLVKPFTEKFSSQTLQHVHTLVISNALNESNIDKWEQPVSSAFDEHEIQTINEWVKNGGSLFLIADHMPFSSASKNLAASFGFSFSDGYAKQKVTGSCDLFCRKANMLRGNEITNGSNESEYVDSVVTFTGQAFKIPDSAISILNFNDAYAQYSPQTAGDFKDCKAEDITGLSQGAFMKYGQGRIVVFGEAAMFSGQLGGGLSWIKIGLNSPDAKYNYRLLLNIMHWLDNKK